MDKDILSDIRRLSESEINKIAAGEVIGGPVNVVKELVENSIDSGADHIEVSIKSGGCNFISVLDNGCGISKDQLELSLERHSTSKLEDQDVMNIKFLGFRGEALSSISAISRMEISSRTQNQDTGWKVVVVGGEIVDFLPVSMSCGTYITVNDLFFVTPARLKFLKSEAKESSDIIRYINKFALLYGHISLKLFKDEIEYLNYLKVDDIVDRFCYIKELGDIFANNNEYVEITHDDIRVKAYISPPTLSFYNSSRLLFFVNGRSIENKILQLAVKNTYGDLLVKGKYPIVILYLSVNSDEIDVNVHPNKSEIRFRRYNAVLNVIKMAIQNGLGIASKIVAVDNDKLNKIIHKDYSNNNKILQDSQKNTDFLDLKFSKPIDNKSANYNNEDNHYEKKTYERNKYSINTNDERVFSQDNIIADPNRSSISKDNDNSKDYKSFKNIINNQIDIVNDTLNVLDDISDKNYFQLNNKYIILEMNEGLMIIDQHAAHERMLYEDMKSRIKDNNILSQEVLITEVYNCTKEDMEIINSNIDEIRSFGIILDIIADNVILRSIPVAIQHKINISSLINDIVDNIREYGYLSFIMSLFHDVLGNDACKSAIKAGKHLSKEEIKYFIKNMDGYINNAQCNHGRPTYMKLKITDLDKLFERC